MPRGRTQEGYPCKYAPYYRGHCESKYIPDTFEEKERISRHMPKTIIEIDKNLRMLEEMALPNEQYGKHYFHELREKFRKRAGIATIGDARMLDLCLEETREALENRKEKNRTPRTLLCYS